MADSVVATFIKSRTENGNAFAKLDLTKLHIQEIPTSLLELSDLQLLCLDYNRIICLPEDFCCTLRCLTSLSLDGNSLSKLPENISSLSNLNDLSINENNLTKLPESFVFLSRLHTLKMVGNSLRKLPSNFGNLKQLKELSVDENDLKELPETFSLLTELERFDANQNKLKYLPCEFGNLESLKFLDLSNNCLTCLPNTFKNLPALRVVDLTDNLISSLPDTFLSAKTLVKLFMDNNNLSELPGWFSNLENMEELSLQNNHFRNTPFPSDFGKNAQCLRHIDLRGNFISALPDSFGDLTSLELIDMGSVLPELERMRSLYNGNFLVRLPDNFGSLVNLKEVHLDENIIEELPESFGCLANLEILDLNHNSLSRLPDSFCNLKTLTVCMLSINSLVELPKDFGNLGNLTELRLDNNMLTCLPESFSKLTKLHSLDLYCNALKVLPVQLKHLTNLKRLDLNENDFGIPVLDVPEIVHKAQYRERDPSMKDNWRGKKRADILDRQLVPQNGEDSGFERLQKALEQGLSLWRKHEEEETERQPAVNGDADYSACGQSNTSLDESEDDYESESEESNLSSCYPCTTEVRNVEAEEFWDLDPLPDPFGYYEDQTEPAPCQIVENPETLFIPASKHPAPFKVERIFVQPCEGQFDDAD